MEKIGKIPKIKTCVIFPASLWKACHWNSGFGIPKKSQPKATFDLEWDTYFSIFHQRWIFSGILVAYSGKNAPRSINRYIVDIISTDQPCVAMSSVGWLRIIMGFNRRIICRNAAQWLVKADLRGPMAHEASKLILVLYGMNLKIKTFLFGVVSSFKSFLNVASWSSSGNHEPYVHLYPSSGRQEMNKLKLWFSLTRFSGTSGKNLSSTFGRQVSFPYKRRIVSSDKFLQKMFLGE